MKTLLINAHLQPHKDTFTKQLHTQFVKQWQAQNPENTLTVLNLAEAHIPRLDDAVLTLFQKQAGGHTLSETECQTASVMQGLLMQFKAHQRIVIAMPLHNFGIPSTLKDYMDNILIARETFRYVSGGSIGLMTDNRKALLLQASGSVYSEGDRYPALEFSHHYLREMFVNIMGFEQFDIVRAEGTSISSLSKEQILDKAFADMDRVLSTFA